MAPGIRSLVGVGAIAVLAVAGLGGDRRSRGGGAASEGPVRDLQRIAEPRRRGPAGGRPLGAAQPAVGRHRPAGPPPAGRQRGRDHPAHPTRRPADQRVRLRRGRCRRRPLPAELPRREPDRRRADHLPVPVRRPVEHRHPVGVQPRQRRRRPANDPDDAFGFGFFPGQFGMAVFSKYPIDVASVRTFQLFLWKDMPGNLHPARLLRRRRAGGAQAVVEVATGTSRSRSARRPSTSSSAIRRRRCSTGPRTATAAATSTRSASGPTTSTRGRAPTSTTTPARSGGLANGCPLRHRR